MPVFRTRRRSSVAQDLVGADDPRCGVSRPARLAFGHPAKLRARDRTIVDGVSNSPGANHYVRRAVGQRTSLAAGLLRSARVALCVAFTTAGNGRPGDQAQRHKRRKCNEPAHRAGFERASVGGDLGVGRRRSLALKSFHRLTQGFIVAAHRLITSIEQTPDIRAYTLLLAFVLGLLLAADSRAHDPAGHTAQPPAGIGEAAR